MIADASPVESSSRLDYFARRWNGQVSGDSLLLRDILLVGTTLNVATGFISLMLLAKGVTLGAVLIHFAMVPYNLFLVLSLWRLTGSSKKSNVIAAIWFAIVTLV